MTQNADANLSKKI